MATGCSGWVLLPGVRSTPLSPEFSDKPALTNNSIFTSFSVRLYRCLCPGLCLGSRKVKAGYGLLANCVPGTRKQKMPTLPLQDNPQGRQRQRQHQIFRGNILDWRRKSFIQWIAPHRQRHPTCTNRYKPFVSGDEGAFLSSPFPHFVQLPKQDAPRERAPGRRIRSGTSTSRTRTGQADEIRDPDVEHAHQAGGREQGPRRRGRPRGPSHTVHTHQFPRRRVGVRKVRVLQGARSRHCSDGRPSITRPHFDAMLSPHDRRFQQMFSTVYIPLRGADLWTDVRRMSNVLIITY